MGPHFCLFLVLSFVGAVTSCLEGTLDPELILSAPFHEVQGSCTEDSFFQIELLPVADPTLDVSQYTFSIVEQTGSDPLIDLDSSNATNGPVFLSTHGSYFNLSASVQAVDAQSIPFSVHYKEFPFVKNDSTFEPGNGTKIGTLGPNHQFTYQFLATNPGDQFFDVTFQPQSSATAFLAIRNGNGRISLMTSPTTAKEPFKVVVSANSTIRLDLITQNGRFNGSDVSYRIDYSVGNEDPTTSTTPPTTTTTPKQMASARIYVLEVNAQEFYNQSIETMQRNLSNALALCDVTFSEASECRHACMMSDDPDRSCVTFETSVAFSYFCDITTDKALAAKVDTLINGWESDFKVSRIEVNDCLTPAQKYWIPVAVGVPLAAMAFVLVGLAIIRSFKAKKKVRASKYSRMMSERNSKVSNGRRSRGNTFGNANQQFEFVD